MRHFRPPRQEKLQLSNLVKNLFDQAVDGIFFHPAVLKSLRGVEICLEQC